MQIITRQSSLLSNNEVYAHLMSKRTAPQVASTSTTADKKPRDRPPQRKLKAPNYEAVSREILEYLSPQASSKSTAGSTEKNHKEKDFPLPPYATTHSDANVQGLIRELASFQLTEAEVLMIVNLRPRDLGGLDAVVEEIDVRFNEEALQEEILACIAKWLGS